MSHDGQVWDTLQVPCHALAEMSLSAIGKLTITPRNVVAIHSAIVQKHRCDPRCRSTLRSNWLATIYKPSKVKKNPAKCTSPPGSLVALALPPSNQNQ
jgi:hypothetical protein